MVLAIHHVCNVWEVPLHNASIASQVLHFLMGIVLHLVFQRNIMICSHLSVNHAIQAVRLASMMPIIAHLAFQQISWQRATHAKVTVLLQHINQIYNVSNAQLNAIHAQDNHIALIVFHLQQSYTKIFVTPTVLLGHTLSLLLEHYIIHAILARQDVCLALTIIIAAPVLKGIF